MNPWTPQEEVDRYCRVQAARAGDEGAFDIGPFDFEAGGRLEQLKIGFVTHGRLNAQRDNAVVLLPGTTNTRHSADGYIGRGNAFDPDRHFVIAFEAIGSGTSSKPSDGMGADFPSYNIRDLVRSQYLVATRHFGLERVAAVAGASMGAFQALEWAIAYPDFMRSAVLIVPAGRASHIFRSVVGTSLEVLQLDPRWGQPTADMRNLGSLRAAVRLYFPWTVTDSYLERMPLQLLEREIQAAIERSSQWHPWDFLRRYEASASHDVAVPFGGDLARALREVRARTLIMPTSSERLLGADSAAQLHRHIEHSRLIEVQTDRGHLGWRATEGACETATFSQEISRYLQETTA